MPGEKNAIRLIIHHGDNQPVDIRHITATYGAPTLHFLAHTAGDYAVYGGNKEVLTPRYDLSLVQSELLASLPEDARMGRITFFREPGPDNRICEAFADTGWGL